MPAMGAGAMYRRVQASTATPAQLAAMLCMGALKFTVKAERALEEKDIEGCHNFLVRAQACVAELQASLDFQRGGPVAEQLYSLYEFAGRRLVEANVRKDRQAMAEAREVLSHLQQTWSMLVNPEQAPPAVNAP